MEDRLDNLSAWYTCRIIFHLETTRSSDDKSVSRSVGKLKGVRVRGLYPY